MIFVNGVPIRLNYKLIVMLYWCATDVPFLQLDLPVIGTSLSSNKFLEIANGILRATLDSNCAVGMA